MKLAYGETECNVPTRQQIDQEEWMPGVYIKTEAVENATLNNYRRNSDKHIKWAEN